MAILWIWTVTWGFIDLNQRIDRAVFLYVDLRITSASFYSSFGGFFGSLAWSHGPSSKLIFISIFLMSFSQWHFCLQCLYTLDYTNPVFKPHRTFLSQGQLTRKCYPSNILKFSLPCHKTYSQFLEIGKWQLPRRHTCFASHVSTLELVKQVLWPRVTTNSEIKLSDSTLPSPDQQAEDLHLLFCQNAFLPKSPHYLPTFLPGT